MAVPASVRLLDVEPDLGRYLTDADVDALEGLAVPALDVPAGELDLAGLMAAHHAFGMVVLDGMLVRRIVVGEAATLRLLGPGDVLGAATGFSSALISDQGWRAAAPTRLAVLDREVLMAAHRAPRVVAGLHARSTEQAERIAVSLAICQLPRVEDRVLSLLWLLAESWGQVTTQGTALRLHLTHETIGGLVGARRSTVTLALGELTDSGAILRQERGWLLLEAPPSFAGAAASEPGPELLEPLAPDGRVDGAVAVDSADFVARVQRLRETTRHLSMLRDDARRRMEVELKRLLETRRQSDEIRASTRARRSVAAGVHHHDDAGNGVGALQREADDAAPEVLPPPVDGVDL